MTTKKLQKDDKVSSPKEKKSAKKAVKKLDVKSLNGTVSDIAYLIGVTTPNINQLLQSGVMRKNDDGTMNYVDNVSSYCRAMRERKAGSSKTDIDKELSMWKLLNLKQKNRDWRMQRDRMVATEILRVLANSMGEIRELVKFNPALADEFDAVIARIGSIDVDDISLAVEGDEEEDEE